MCNFSEMFYARGGRWSFDTTKTPWRHEKLIISPLGQMQTGALVEALRSKTAPWSSRGPALPTAAPFTWFQSSWQPNFATFAILPIFVFVTALPCPAGFDPRGI
jgi:hypothetical protein